MDVAVSHPNENEGGPQSAETWGLTRRRLLQSSGIAAVALGSGLLVQRSAFAAVPNSLMVGGSGSTKAFGRTTMPSVSGTFRISLDYLYPAGTMNGFTVFSSFDTAYRDPRLLQTGDRLTVVTATASHLIDQPISADVWHRIELRFTPGEVVLHVDGVLQTSGTLSSFPIATGATYSYFGYLGDVSSATYNGTAYFDNLRVVSGGATVFERTFDDGAAIAWTETGVGGTGVFGLASPARNSTYGADVTAKSRATYYTPARRAAAAANIAAHPWAKNERDLVVAAADEFVAKGYPYLWGLVTGQKLPRSYGFRSNEQLGCLNCGTAVHAYGQYPFLADPATKPWKLTCPHCAYTFPTNNFAAYYAGGLDANGLFDPAKAKTHNNGLIAAGGTGNLVNTAHPAKGASWGIDDGLGVVMADGTRYTPIAYYNHWKLWYTGEIQKALQALASAYVYTGNRTYASAGVVLLDRIADVYPSLNIDDWPRASGYLNSNGGSVNRGKAIGSIWETSLTRSHILAYDAFYPALADDSTDPVLPAAIAFLDGVSSADKSTRLRIRKNIEDGLLRQVLPAVRRGDIRGNNGMHQATIAAAAVVIDHLPETDDWLTFNFATGSVSSTAVNGGNMGALFVNDVDRDGNGNEAAPGYNALWLNSFNAAATYLDGYHLAGMADRDLYSNPKFMRMYDGIHPLTMLGRYTPTIGDSGKVGDPALVPTMSQMVTAFHKTGRTEYAQIAHWLNGRSATGLRLGILDDNPEQIANQIQDVVDQHGEWNPESILMSGYGFAALRDGSPHGNDPSFSQRAAEMTVSQSSDPTTHYPSNDVVQFEATAVGDSVTFSFSLATAASGALRLSVWQAPTYGIYSVAVDGAELAARVSMAGSGLGTRTVGSVNLASGNHTLTLTLVEATPGAKCGIQRVSIGGTVSHQRGATLYFGRNGGHGHTDTLNIDHYAFGLDLLPDMGYPRYANSTDMHRKSLVINTIAHNTVVVDDLRQASVVVGFPKGFDAADQVQFVDVDAPQAYAQTSRYRRMLAQVRIDDENSYLVDMFRVVGGTKHLYSFHAMQAASTVATGATLVPQKNASGQYVGTYAGASTPYNDTVDDPKGFSYFYDVDRATGSFGDLTVTWQGLKDTWGVMGAPAGTQTDVNVRLSLLGNHTDIALANCEPPDNKPGNPSSLRYLLARPSVSAGTSTVTGVIDAYRGTRVVQGVQAATVTTLAGAATTNQQVRAVRVTLPGGRVDTVVHALDPAQVYLVDGVRFSGAFGVRTVVDGTVSRVHLVEGSEYGTEVTGKLRALTGTVAAFTQTLSDSNSVTVALTSGQASAVTPATLVGRHIFVADDGVRNAVYRIESVDSFTASQAVFSIGRVTPIRSYRNSANFAEGFIYDLAVGKSFRIPLRHTA